MYGDRRVRPTFARESAYIVVKMERYGHVLIPRGLVPWRPGRRVFFCVIDGRIVVSFKPLKLYRGRYISTVLKRTVWRKTDYDFMRRTTLAKENFRPRKSAAEVIRLSPADQQCFAEMLLSPPEASPALRRAMVRHEQWGWGSTVKDRCHDEAMAEMFKQDPAFAVELVNSILDDGDQDDLQTAFRQMDKAGLFDRTGVLYEVACDVLGAIVAHYSEALALERGEPVPDAAAVERIDAAKCALRLERDELNPLDAKAIQSVILKYGALARSFFLDDRTRGEP